MKYKISSFFKQIKLNGKVKIAILCIIVFIAIISLVLLLKEEKVKLSCKDAEKIVLEKLGSGTVTSCKRDGKSYEIEVVINNYFYEFEIDANTGKIIEYEGDYKDDLYH